MASFALTGHEMPRAIRVQSFAFAFEKTRREEAMHRQTNPKTVAFLLLVSSSSGDAIGRVVVVVVVPDEEEDEEDVILNSFFCFTFFKLMDERKRERERERERESYYARA